MRPSLDAERECASPIIYGYDEMRLPRSTRPTPKKQTSVQRRQWREVADDARVGGREAAQPRMGRREADRPARHAANAASAGVTEKFTMLRQIARNDGGSEGGRSGGRSDPEGMVETPRRDPAARQSVASAPVHLPVASQSLSPSPRKHSRGLKTHFPPHSLAPP